MIIITWYEIYIMIKITYLLNMEVMDLCVFENLETIFINTNKLIKPHTLAKVHENICYVISIK